MPSLTRGKSTSLSEMQYLFTAFRLLDYSHLGAVDMSQEGIPSITIGAPDSVWQWPPGQYPHLNPKPEYQKQNYPRVERRATLFILGIKDEVYGKKNEEQSYHTTSLWNA